MTPATGRFRTGDRVKVKFEDRPGHLRTPWYIRGKSGWIERVYGDFLNPELLAFGKDGMPKKTLYLVAFDYSEVFGKSLGPKDKVLVDIYDHWLDPQAQGNVMSDDHGHDHPKHELSYYAKRIYAMRELLVDKGVITEKDIQCQIEYQEARTPANGAKLIAKAWIDAAFRARFIADPKAACAEIGIDATALNEFVVLENTPQVRHMVVCTLCSCYPRPILGRPPDWYKSFNYRQRSVSDPRGVMREFGLELPDDVEVRVHDSTADIRYIVMPMRPAGTAGWSEEDLAKLVTRDSMVGVMDALPMLPE